ncbi:MAG TPA: helix-turn-helix domain-containing protein [Mycobacteriales bacterium]|nr:helix-turn-helix domain-containing protein [Mycobacteriales bacterium]
MAATGADQVDAVLHGLGNAVAAEHDRDPALLAGYLPALLHVAATAGRLSGEQRDACRRIGADAARSGVALPVMVDLYMTASRRLWPQLPELVAARRGRRVRPGELMGLGDAVWRAADEALAALAAGFVQAQLLLVRTEEAAHQQFVDDLLTGAGSVGPLVERAEPFGLSLGAAHLVGVLALPEPVEVAGPVTDRVQASARHRFGSTRGLLVTAKDGLLVCALSAGPAHRADATDGQLAGLVEAVAAELAGGKPWRAALSRAHSGPLGISRCWTEATDALRVAQRLALPDPLVHARDLLVYRVLLRDQAALADLVEAVLGPLVTARDGPDRLLPTLQAYVDSGSSTAATARALHLSVRAMSYRLQRISALTGRSTNAPQDRLALHVAAVGARLLDWPRQPLNR